MKSILAVIVVCLELGTAGAGEPVRVVTFETEDGVKIIADYYKPAQGPGPVAVLLHMYRSDRSGWTPLVPVLRESGFAVLAIDMRGHGESTSPDSMRLQQRVASRDEKLFNTMQRDVAAACAFLASQPKVDMTRIALVGASVGCSVAIHYAARDRSVDVVVCMTPGEKYLGVDSTKHIRRYGKRPILLLATEGERAASDKLARLNAAAAVRIVGSGTVHGTRMFGAISGIEERIASFLRDNLGTREGLPVVAEIDADEYFAIGSKEHMAMSRDKVRWFSSVAEARARGLTGPESPYEGRLDDRLMPKDYGTPPP